MNIQYRTIDIWQKYGTKNETDKHVYIVKGIYQYVNMKKKTMRGVQNISGSQEWE